MFRRRTLYIVFAILGLFLLGTVIVLSSVSYYLAIDDAAYLSDLEVPVLDNVTRWNASEYGKVERIPRIIHQTWKSETLPPQWKNVSQGCRDMMPDYEYMLWTDASSREFIAEHYSWFLDYFDNYPYAIQRADAIRYFVLYHYGGVYLDLDVGCMRPLDPLLIYPIILPKTIPVGVSNDLMFAQKEHPFLLQTIYNLIPFDHSWILNYPTVMFSTGPMFLSAQYGIYVASHPLTLDQPGGEVRILPKSLYGKNAKPEEAPHSFFAHYYGSSWHADDAAFIWFLGTWGKALMWVGLVVLVLGVLRLLMSTNQRKYGLRRIGGYEVLLPRWVKRNGRWQLDLRWSLLPLSGSSTEPSSPLDSPAPAPLEEADDSLPLFDLRSSSPAPSEFISEGFSNGHTRNHFSIFDTLRRAKDRAMSLIIPSRESMPPRDRRPRSRSRGVLFFLPAMFTWSQNYELAPRSPRPSPSRFPDPTYDASSEKQRYEDDDLEYAGLMASNSLSEPQQRRSRSPGVPVESVSSGSSNLLIDTADGNS